MRKKVRKSLAFLLALALVVSVMSGLGLSVSADDAQNEPVVTETEGEPAEEKLKAEESTPKEGEEEEEADPDAEAVPEEKKDEQKAEGEGSGDSSAADPVEPADEPSTDADATTLTEEQQAQYKAVYEQIMACTDADELAKLLEQYGEDELFGIYMEQYLTDEEKAAWDAKINAPATLALQSVTIADSVKTDGLLTANITPADTADVTYTWQRSGDGKSWEDVERVKKTGDQYNIPEENGNTLNVALDEGAQKYYRVVASAGEVNVPSSSVKINYYDQIQNGSFETPILTDKFQPELTEGNTGIVWKTTASDKRIEIVSAATNKSDQNETHQYLSERWHGMTKAAEGTQYAELNAEKESSLYQDVLTTPGATMNWQVAHAARLRNGYNIFSGTDTMYVVIMAADKAESLSSDQALLKSVAKKLADNDTATLNDYPGAKSYKFTASQYDTWNLRQGTYTVPEKQYLTRYFFVAADTAWDDNGNTDKINTVGNHIDNIWFSTKLPPPSPDKGNLAVTKTVSGLSEIPDEYTVEISKGTDKITFTKDNFTRNADGTYTASGGWSNLVLGSYTVTETVSNVVDGYDLSTTYTVDAGATQTGSTANATVAENKTTTVAFTNTYTKATADLTINKKIMVDDEEYKGTDFNNASYTFTVSGDKLQDGVKYNVGDTEKTVANKTLTATVNGAGTVTIKDLPLGDYTITESEKGTDPAGYKFVETKNSDETVTLTANNAEKTITNYYKKVGSLKIKKTVTGLDTGVTNSNKYKFTVTGPNKYSQTVEITGAGEETLTDLELGSYTVTETGADYTIDGYTWAGLPDAKTAGVVHKGTVTAEITNVYHKNPKVTIKKQVTGNMYQESDTFSFKTTLTGVDSSFSLSANNTAGKVIEIPYGGGFTVTEERNSLGYTLKTINVNKTAVTISENGCTLSNVTTDTEVIFTNDKTINPPNGIITTIAPYAIMVVLAAGAGVYFVYSRRRRNG